MSKTERESEEYIDLKEKIHRADVDLNYTLYCPLAEKYTSLYKSTDDAGNSSTTLSNDSMISQGSESLVHRPPMWSIVEACMAEGTLWALRDGKLGHPVSADGTEHAAVEKQGLSQRTKKSVTLKSGKRGMMKPSSISAKDDTSDDGFFEE